MKMNVDFGTHYYELEFVPFLGLTSESYQHGFNEWYYELVEESDTSGMPIHCYRKREELDYDTLDIQVILDWFIHASPECQVKVVNQHNGCTVPNTHVPTLYF